MHSSLFALLVFAVAMGSNDCVSITSEATVKLIPNDVEHVTFLDGTLTVICCGEAIRWIKPDGNVLDQEDKDERVHVEAKNDQLILNLFNINGMDIGIWTCLSAIDNTKVAFNLKKFYPTAFVKFSSEQTARVGHDVKIKCKVSGVPTVKIEWDFNGKPLVYGEKFDKQESGALLVRNVTQQNDGIFTCKATQKLGFFNSFQERDIHLNVEYEPDTSNNKLLVFGQHNSYVKLSCQGDGNPPAEIKWSRNGEDIYQNVHINKQISTLEVLIQSRRNYGTYQCNVKNEWGDKEVTIVLQQGDEMKDEVDNKSNSTSIIGTTFLCILLSLLLVLID